MKLYIFYHKNEYPQRKIGPNSILGKETIAIVDHCDTKGCYKKEITYGCSDKLKPWFDSKEKNWSFGGLVIPNAWGNKKIL